MDDLDRRLLSELQKDGRAHLTKLASKLRVPRSTVQERLKRLQSEGIVKRFAPVLDHAKVGRPTLAFILATFNSGTGGIHRQAARDLLKIPGVESVDMLSGDWDLLIKVRGESLEQIGNLVIDRLRTVPSIARTVTMASFHSEEGPSVLPT